MANANYEGFFNKEAETVEEIKAEKKAKDRSFKIQKENMLLGGTLALMVLILSGTTLIATSQRSEAKTFLTAITKQVSDLQKEKEEATERSNVLTQKKFEQNIKLLTTLDTITTDKKNGLGGYFVASKQYYTIVKYDIATGQLFTIQTNEKPTDENIDKGIPVIMSNDWVEALVARLKADK